jgi:hypothetical protein
LTNIRTEATIAKRKNSLKKRQILGTATCTVKNKKAHPANFRRERKAKRPRTVRRKLKKPAG